MCISTKKAQWSCSLKVRIAKKYRNLRFPRYKFFQISELIKSIRNFINQKEARSAQHNSRFADLSSSLQGQRHRFARIVRYYVNRGSGCDAAKSTPTIWNIRIPRQCSTLQHSLLAATFSNGFGACEKCPLDW